MGESPGGATSLGGASVRRDKQVLRTSINASLWVDLFVYIQHPVVDRLGRYQLLDPIGVGPCGSVTRAKVFGVAGFERQFAIKRFHPEVTASPALAQSLSTGARAYGGLEHPRIARMSEFGVAQGTTFTAVEWVAGLDVQRLINEAKLLGATLPAGGVLALISQAARAVGYAHGRGLSHLGLSPTNVIVNQEGDAKITDFGILAATLSDKPLEAPRLANRIPYLAPEQLANEATSSATDVFVLGVIAHELLVGQRLFKGETPHQIAQAVMAGTPPEPALPRPIVRVLQRCLVRSPFERFPDARALADALDAALRVAPVPGSRKDIGAVVKQTLDRLAELHASELSGAVSLPAAPPPGLARRDSSEDVLSTTEFVRPDVPVSGPTPLKGPAQLLAAAEQTAIGPAATTVPDLPRQPTMTVPGLAPPPIPVPKGVGVAPPPIPPMSPGMPSTMLGLGAVTRPAAKPPAIPAIPKLPTPVRGEPVVRPPSAPPIELAEPPQTPPRDDRSLPAAAPAPTGPSPGGELAHYQPTPFGLSPFDAPLRPNAATPITPTPAPSIPGETVEDGSPIAGESPAAAAIADALAEHALTEQPADLPVERPSETPVSPLLALAPFSQPPTPAGAAVPEPTKPPGLVDDVEVSVQPTAIDFESETLVPTGDEKPPEPGDRPLQPPSVHERATVPGFGDGRLPHVEPRDAVASVADAMEDFPDEPPAIQLGTSTIPSLAHASARQYALHDHVTASPLIMPPMASPPRRRRWPLIAGAAVGSAVVGAGVYIAYVTWFADGSARDPDNRRDGGVVASSDDAQRADKAAVDSGATRPVAPIDAAMVTPADSAKPVDSLSIVSTPPGARVFIDGADAGVTPLKLPGTPDRHTIALLMAGHELYIAQVDGAGAFAIPLKEVTPTGGPAGIKVTRCKDKDRYYVYVDGKPTGQTCPTERIETDLGPHIVEVYDVVSETRRRWEIEVKDTRLSYRVRIDN